MIARRRFLDVAMSAACIIGVVLALASLDPRLHDQLGAVVVSTDAPHTWYSGVTAVASSVYEAIRDAVNGQTTLVVFGTAGVVVLLLLLRT